jgi:hypothetical protein
MNVNIKPYVPILRWRTAEMTALEKLALNDRENITPLVEFIMPAPTTDKKDRRKVIETPKDKFLRNLSEVSKGLSESCGRSPVFIDVHLLDSDIRASSLEQILTSSSNLDLFSIPVTYIIPVTSTNADMETRKVAVDYAKSSGHGLCIRIDRFHLFSESNLPSHIAEFIEKNELDIENTDLLVDLRVVGKDTNAETIVGQLVQLPNLQKWRSFIVSGGVFPKDLTEFVAGEVHPLERLDWKLWNTIRRQAKLLRKPIFSDYTIQHPFYEYVPAVGSASVRYTDENQWWIFRGKIPGLINRKTKEKGPGREQYIDHARTLVKRTFYKQESYSFGDAEINKIAVQDNIKPGNPQKWLAIGINHHLTLVARQIANLAENTEEHS